MFGCGPERREPRSECHKEYNEGVKVGLEEGLDKGYQEGFEAARPGTSENLSPLAHSIYWLSVWGGALKLVASLGIASLYLISHTAKPEEIIGKILFGVLGCALTLVGIAYLPISLARTESILLLPSPPSIIGQFVVLAIAGSAMYWILEMLCKLNKLHGALIEGWLVLLLTGIMTFLVSLLIGIFTSVPDITKYLSASIFTGIIFGGVYYFAHGLLKGKFSRGDQVSNSERGMPD